MHNAATNKPSKFSWIMMKPLLKLVPVLAVLAISFIPAASAEAG